MHEKEFAAAAVRTAGPFSYNTSTLRFYKNGEEISLSAKENALVKLFFDHPGRVFSKAELYTLIWGNDVIDENAIMVYINRIRGKMEDDAAHPTYVQTVRGAGYRFVV
ncbi:MAG: winged helix-turn-helix transcriptional regulator [Clostridia bacterium]|nr:winged helix-turn-helix transcriptional regulator [Clostridia bacterium]